MVALKKAIEEEAEAAQGVSDGSAKSTYTLRPEDAVRTVHTFGFFCACVKQICASRVFLNARDIIYLQGHLLLMVLFNALP